jgi:hypothetical protein
MDFNGKISIYENLVNQLVHIFELQKSTTNNQCIIFKI